MKKVLLIIIIFILVLAALEYSKRSKQEISVPENIPSERNMEIKGYYSYFDKDFIYLTDSDNIEKRIKITPETRLLRTYINEEEVLLLQEEARREDFVKDQYITIDAFWENNPENLKAMIIRQIVYAEMENEQ